MDKHVFGDDFHFTFARNFSWDLLWYGESYFGRSVRIWRSCNSSGFLWKNIKISNKDNELTYKDDISR